MKVFGREVRNKYIAGASLLTVVSLYTGYCSGRIAEKAENAAKEFPYELPPGKVEFKSGKGFPHTFYTRGIFERNDQPKMAFLYETEEKMRTGDWDMIIFSPQDNGSYPVKETRGKNCLKCHIGNARGVDV